MQRLFSVIVVVFCAAFTVVIADFRTEALNLHNKYRCKHHAPPLTLSNELNKVSQNWAKKMATSNRFKHSNGKYGENIYTSTNTKMTDTEAAIAATNKWYDEQADYNFLFATFSPNTGHFTQVVWNSTKYLGIGVARSSKSVYVCANYDPRGNLLSKFVQNVLAS